MVYLERLSSSLSQSVHTFLDQSPRLCTLTRVTAQVAFRALFVLATVAMFAAVTPVSFQAVVMGITSVGTAFLSAFFFPSMPFYPPLPPAAPPEEVAEPVPAAPQIPTSYIRDDGNDSWAIANFMKLMTTKDTRDWLLGDPPQRPEGLEGPAAAEYERFERAFTIYHTQAQLYVEDLANGTSPSRVDSTDLRLAACCLNRRFGADTMEDPHEGLAILSYLKSSHLQFRKGDGEIEEDWGITLSLEGRVERSIPDLLSAYTDAAHRDWVKMPPTLRLCLNRYRLAEQPQPPIAKWFPSYRIPPQREKTADPVQIPLELIIRNDRYRLVAFDHHSGEDPKNGHTSSFVKSGDEWYGMFPGNPHPLTAEALTSHLSSGNTYQLWYEKVELPIPDLAD